MNDNQLPLGVCGSLCDQCGKQLSNDEELKNHQATMHSAENPTIAPGGLEANDLVSEGKSSPVIEFEHAKDAVKAAEDSARTSRTFSTERGDTHSNPEGKDSPDSASASIEALPDLSRRPSDDSFHDDPLPPAADTSKTYILPPPSPSFFGGSNSRLGSSNLPKSPFFDENSRPRVYSDGAIAVTDKDLELINMFKNRESMFWKDENVEYQDEEGEYEC